jgi:hypothetical protein
MLTPRKEDLPETPPISHPGTLARRTFKSVIFFTGFLTFHQY